MQVRFRTKALNELKETIDYFDGIAPGLADNILADIDKSISRLKDFPQLGAFVPGYPLRRLVTRKYRFKIAYQVTSEAIVIVGIFRFQDRDV
jgi:plasmid stabilization system protein ParE